MMVELELDVTHVCVCVCRVPQVPQDPLVSLVLRDSAVFQVPEETVVFQAELVLS